MNVQRSSKNEAWRSDAYEPSANAGMFMKPESSKNTPSMDPSALVGGKFSPCPVLT